MNRTPVVGKIHVSLAYGLETVNFVKSITKTSKTLPVQFILNTEKFRDDMSQLKCPVAVFIRNKVLYSITCSVCDALYVGQTNRHLTTRLEHCRMGTPVREHFESCGVSSGEVRWQSRIVDSAKSVDPLLSLEALRVGDLQPQVITKVEFSPKSLMLRMGLFEATLLVL